MGAAGLARQVLGEATERLSRSVEGIKTCQKSWQSPICFSAKVAAPSFSLPQGLFSFPSLSVQLLFGFSQFVLFL